MPLPRSALLLSTVVALAAPAHAAEPDPPVDCTNAQSTYEINFCADKELSAADAKLNEVYNLVLARIPKISGEKPYDAASFEAALRSSQRSWVSFRDADCKALVPMSWQGGTGTTADVLGCLQEKTKARTEELRGRYLAQ